MSAKILPWDTLAIQDWKPCTRSPGLDAGLTVLIAQPLHVSKKPGSTVEEREHCVPSISFVLGDFFLRKVMWREEPARKQQTSARSLFQCDLEKMTDLGWSCCQKRWLKRSKPEMEIRRMPEAWKKNKLSRYDWLDGFKIKLYQRWAWRGAQNRTEWWCSSRSCLLKENKM